MLSSKNLSKQIMKKKPELLMKTGKPSLTLKSFLKNLKENDLHYENKQITQCVFLGVLRLKPVPSMFANSFSAISSKQQIVNHKNKVKNNNSSKVTNQNVNKRLINNKGVISGKINKKNRDKIKTAIKKSNKKSNLIKIKLNAKKRQLDLQNMSNSPPSTSLTSNLINMSSKNKQSVMLLEENVPETSQSVINTLKANPVQLLFNKLKQGTSSTASQLKTKPTIETFESTSSIIQSTYLSPNKTVRKIRSINAKSSNETVPSETVMPIIINQKQGIVIVKQNRKNKPAVKNTSEDVIDILDEPAKVTKRPDFCDDIVVITDEPKEKVKERTSPRLMKANILQSPQVPKDDVIVISDKPKLPKTIPRLLKINPASMENIRNLSEPSATPKINGIFVATEEPKIVRTSPRLIKIDQTDLPNKSSNKEQNSPTREKTPPAKNRTETTKERSPSLKETTSSTNETTSKYNEVLVINDERRSVKTKERTSPRFKLDDIVEVKSEDPQLNYDELSVITETDDSIPQMIKQKERTSPRFSKCNTLTATFDEEKFKPDFDETVDSKDNLINTAKQLKACSTKYLNPKFIKQEFEKVPSKEKKVKMYNIPRKLTRGQLKNIMEQSAKKQLAKTVEYTIVQPNVSYKIKTSDLFNVVNPSEITSAKLHKPRLPEGSVKKQWLKPRKLKNTLENSNVVEPVNASVPLENTRKTQRRSILQKSTSMVFENPPSLEADKKIKAMLEKSPTSQIDLQVSNLLTEPPIEIPLRKKRSIMEKSTCQSQEIKLTRFQNKNTSVEVRDVVLPETKSPKSNNSNAGKEKQKNNDSGNATNLDKNQSTATDVTQEVEVPKLNEVSVFLKEEEPEMIQTESQKKILCFDLDPEKSSNTAVDLQERCQPMVENEKLNMEKMSQTKNFQSDKPTIVEKNLLSDIPIIVEKEQKPKRTLLKSNNNKPEISKYKEESNSKMGEESLIKKVHEIKSARLQEINSPIVIDPNEPSSETIEQEPLPTENKMTEVKKTSLTKSENAVTCGSKIKKSPKKNSPAEKLLVADLDEPILVEEELKTPRRSLLKIKNKRSLKISEETSKSNENFNLDEETSIMGVEIINLSEIQEINLSTDVINLTSPEPAAKPSNVSLEIVDLESVQSSVKTAKEKSVKASSNIVMTPENKITRSQTKKLSENLKSTDLEKAAVIEEELKPTRRNLRSKANKSPEAIKVVEVLQSTLDEESSMKLEVKETKSMDLQEKLLNTIETQEAKKLPEKRKSADLEEATIIEEEHKPKRRNLRGKANKSPETNKAVEVLQPTLDGESSMKLEVKETEPINLQEKLSTTIETQETTKLSQKRKSADNEEVTVIEDLKSERRNLRGKTNKSPETNKVDSRTKLEVKATESIKLQEKHLNTIETKQTTTRSRLKKSKEEQSKTVFKFENKVTRSQTKILLENSRISNLDKEVIVEAEIKPKKRSPYKNRTSLASKNNSLTDQQLNQETTSSAVENLKPVATEPKMIKRKYVRKSWPKTKKSDTVNVTNDELISSSSKVQEVLPPVLSQSVVQEKNDDYNFVKEKLKDITILPFKETSNTNKQVATSSSNISPKKPAAKTKQASIKDMFKEVFLKNELKAKNAANATTPLPDANSSKNTSPKENISASPLENVTAVFQKTSNSTVSRSPLVTIRIGEEISLPENNKAFQKSESQADNNLPNEVRRPDEDEVFFAEDSDSESKAEWMPEDYAEYKFKYSAQKLTTYKPIHKCKICLKILPSYYRLNKHKKEHFKEKRPYNCPHCDQTFALIDDLTAHLRIHKGKHPYTCKKCNKGFWSKKSLENHQPVHVLRKVKQTVKRFRCDVCAKEFGKLCDMERHTRVHTGEKPCVCNICNKRFQQSHNLSKHLLTHLHVKPYHCEICNRQFGRNDVLNRHLLTHSIEKPFKCAVCSKGFIRQTQLDQHTNKHHVKK